MIKKLLCLVIAISVVLSMAVVMPASAADEDDSIYLSTRNVFADKLAKVPHTPKWNSQGPALGLNTKGQYFDMSLGDSKVKSGEKWYWIHGKYETDWDQAWVVKDDRITITGFVGWHGYAYDGREKSNKMGRVFKPITDGSAFTVKTKFTPYMVNTRFDGRFCGYSISLRLTNDEPNALEFDYTKTFTLLNYGVEPENYECIVALGAVNLDHVDRGSAIETVYTDWGAKTQRQWSSPFHNKLVTLSADFIPSGDNYYVIIKCTDQAGNILLKTDTPVVVSKADVATYSRFQIGMTYDYMTFLYGADGVKQPYLQEIAEKARDAELFDIYEVSIVKGELKDSPENLINIPESSDDEKDEEPTVKDEVEKEEVKEPVVIPPVKDETEKEEIKEPVVTPPVKDEVKGEVINRGYAKVFFGFAGPRMPGYKIRVFDIFKTLKLLK